MADMDDEERVRISPEGVHGISRGARVVS